MVGARTTYRVSFVQTLALYPRVRTSVTLSAPDQRSLIGGDLRCENTLRYGTRNIAASSARTKIQLNVSKLTIVPRMIIDPANPFWRISSNAGLLNRNSPDCLLGISARRRCLWLIRRRDQGVLRSANIRSSQARAALGCGATLTHRLAPLSLLGWGDLFAVAFVLLERWDRFGFPGLSLGCLLAL
jgi:hypothetical protein